MELKTAALRAFRLVLLGLARMLLESSVTSREAEELVRETLVEVALRNYGLRGRQTNVSRVAMLTGLDRREVARVRARLDERDDSQQLEDVHPFSRVLSGWHLDPVFSEDGVPHALDLDDADAGLPALLARYAPALPPVAVRKELLRVGALELVDGRAHARSRYYLNPDLDPRQLERYGSVTSDLIATLNHNVMSAERHRSRLEGRAVVRGLSVADAESLRQLVDAQGESFLEDVDAWLEAHARPDGPVRAGVGIYLIHDDGEKK